MEATPTPAAPVAAAPEAAAPPAPPAPPRETPTYPAGTKFREYETIYALKPDLLDDAVEKTKERIRDLIHREGGKVIRTAIWGKKKTHYEIAKASRAVYIHTHYLGPAKIVAEVERNLRMIDDVVRYQTVKIAEETDASKPVEQDIKLAGDADQPDRPPREERDHDRGPREDFGDAPFRDRGDDRDDAEPESA